MPPKEDEPDASRKRRGRRPRGNGAVFFSEAHDRWIWRAVVENKPDGSPRYKEGRALTRSCCDPGKGQSRKGQLNRETKPTWVNIPTTG